MTPQDLPVTEQDNPRTRQISSQPVAAILDLIDDEDATVAAAVRRELGAVGRAIEGIVARLERGGRLFYVGCGTSGRLGVLDASECPPTYGVAADLVRGIIAGGYDACHRAVEASEDDRGAGARDLAANGVTAADAVVGLAASGRTPYTVGAIERAAARRLHRGGDLRTRLGDHPGRGGPDRPDSRPRGADRLVANEGRHGTEAHPQHDLDRDDDEAGIGERQPHVEHAPGNTKLRGRAVRIMVAETGATEEAARAALEDGGGDLATALVMLKSGHQADAAREALAAAHGVVAAAVAWLAER